VVPLSGQIAATFTGYPSPYCYISTGNTCVTSQASALTFAPSVGGGATAAQQLVISSTASGGLVGNPLLFYNTNNIAQTPSTANTLSVTSSLSTDHTIPGAIPAYDPNNQIYYETSIFTIDAQGHISAVWVNQDGTTYPLVFYVDGPPAVMFASASPGYSGTVALTLV